MLNHHWAPRGQLLGHAADFQNARVWARPFVICLVVCLLLLTLWQSLVYLSVHTTTSSRGPSLRQQLQSETDFLESTSDIDETVQVRSLHRRDVAQSFAPCASLGVADGSMAPHAYTNRGFNEHWPAFPPFLNLSEYLHLHPPRAMLELGAGSGHSMLDIQAAFPGCELHGTNYEGYAYQQARSREDLLLAASTFHVPVMCAADDLTKPLLPTVHLIPSLDTFSLRSLPVPPAHFDVVFSMHTINKLKDKSKLQYLRQVMHMLRPGGLALLHWGDFVRINVAPDVPSFRLVHSITWVDSEWAGDAQLGRISLVTIVQRSSDWLPPGAAPTSPHNHWVVLLLRRCSASDHVNALGDCIVPDYFAQPYYRANLTQLDAEVRSSNHAAHKGDAWINFAQRMETWEEWLTRRDTQ